MATTLTPERLLTKAYWQIAESGTARTTGPDPKGTQMLAIYDDVQLCILNNDVDRKEYLLTKAQAKYGN